MAMERALKAKAAKMGLKGRRAAAFVYGTMRKAGWHPHVTPPKVDWKRHPPKAKKRKKR